MGAPVVVVVVVVGAGWIGWQPLSIFANDPHVHNTKGPLVRL